MNKEKLGYVYKITSPSGKVYIGSTINIKRRFAAYKSLQCRAQIKVYNSFLKYGIINHIFEIVWIGNFKEMLYQEFTFGKLFDVLNRDKGLNLKLPKINDTYSCYSIETREKMSVAAKNKIFSLKTRKKISDFHKGKIVSKETRLKMSNSQIGRKMSKEAKLKMSLARKGKVNSIETNKKISERMKIPVLQFDKNNNFIKEWCCADVAGKTLNIQPCHIAGVCKNKRKTIGGFIWKYK